MVKVPIADLAALAYDPAPYRSRPEQLSGLADGDLVFQNGVEHGESGLFFWVQRNVLHKMDIFADQLADDRIVEQQHVCQQSSAHAVHFISADYSMSNILSDG